MVAGRQGPGKSGAGMPVWEVGGSGVGQPPDRAQADGHHLPCLGPRPFCVAPPGWEVLPIWGAGLSQHKLRGASLAPTPPQSCFLKPNQAACKWVWLCRPLNAAVRQSRLAAKRPIGLVQAELISIPDPQELSLPPTLSKKPASQHARQRRPSFQGLPTWLPSQPASTVLE